MSGRADQVAALFRAAAVTIADAFHVGRYELLRPVKTADAMGGFTEELTVVESGRCSLSPSGQQTGDRQDWTVTTAVGPYIAELPVTSVVQSTDRLRITVNNRDNEVRLFEVIGAPQKGDDMELFVTVNVELVR